MVFKRFKVRSYEVGLLFRDGEFQGLLNAGNHWFLDLFNKVKVELASRRTPWLVHEQLDLIVKSGLLGDQAIVVDLKDHERGLVWIENRFSHVLPAGQYVYWLGQKQVRVEIVDARQVAFQHPEFKAIVRSPMAGKLLEVTAIKRDHTGVLFVDGRYVERVEPGEYAYWKGTGEARLVEVDLRETMVDVAGQEIMTADKVTLRMNAVVTYRIEDAKQAISQTDDVRQALYRETQLVLRAVVGARNLDILLTDKDIVSKEIEEGVRVRAAALGLKIASIGIRDLILPGDMKDLMNKVTEAHKAAEANLIYRREETAAMRSQANTAKLLQDNPTLMRLRELEVLEKIAASGKLNVFLGEKGLGDKGLADRVTNLL